MAPLTLAAVLPKVDVILFVARQAVLIELDLRSRLLVAPGTVEFPVSPCKGESSLLAVVELPELPAVRRVALGAFLSERTLMRVILFVAGNAITVDVAVFASGVTLFARHCNV